MKYEIKGFSDLFIQSFLRHEVEAGCLIAVILQWKFSLPSEFDYENGVILVSVAIFSCRTAAVFIS